MKINRLDKRARPNSTLSVRNELFKYKDTNRVKVQEWKKVYYVTIIKCHAK